MATVGQAVYIHLWKRERDMNDGLLNFYEVFTSRLFRIPDYQRGYAWMERQVSDFWDDAVNLPEGRSHYTGMLSIQKVPEDVYKHWDEEFWLTKKNTTPYFVVDGQQRLTTFSIFIECFVEYMRGLDCNSGKDDAQIIFLNDSMTLKEVVEHYIKQSNPTGVLTAYLFGYEQDNPSFEYMRHEIFQEPNPGNLEKTLYTLNLKNAKTFFAENISAYAEQYGQEALERVFENITSRMVLNIHDISEEFDVFAAFETMNNRGKPLSNLELLKSRLIYITTLLGEDGEEERFIRSVINDCWKEVYWQLGRNAHALPDDEFLQDHWIIRYPYSSRRDSNYEAFLLGKEFALSNVAHSKKSVRANIEDVSFEDRFREEFGEGEDGSEHEPSVVESTVEGGLTGKYIKDYAESLKTTARWWYATFYPDDEGSFSEEERKWIERLGRLGFVYFRPMVVASFLAEDATEAERVALLREIERFIFVAFRMSGAYATYNRNNVYRAAREVASGAITVAEAAADLHRRIEDWIHPETAYDASGFMSRIRRLFTNGDREGYYRWVGLRYLLYEYEDSLVEQFGNAQKKVDYFKVSEKDKVSIEHIYPQTPDNEYWTERFGGYFDEEQRALTGSLGNLLLLSMSINSQLQNDSYPYKKNDKRNDRGELVRCGYSTGSHSENQVSNDYEEWDAEAILDRGMKLLHFVERRWNVRFPDEDSKRKMLFIDFV